MQAKNRAGEGLFNELKFYYSSNGCTVEDLYGEHIHYLQEEEPCFPKSLAEIDRKVLKQVESSRMGNNTYRTIKKKGIRKVARIEKPRGFIEIEYKEAERAHEEDKVKRLIEPLGPQGEKVESYSFNYQKDFTIVFDALGRLKIYRFDPHQRLSRIHYFAQRHIVRTDAFEWSKRPGQEGWLKSKSIQLGDDIFHLKSYRYDARGNIIQTTLYGNLTGEKSETFQESQKEATDRYTIAYAYTEDERNLLKEKKMPEGLVFSYEYLEGTNLCTQIVHIYDGKIQERTLHSYDENGQIAGTIEDDGEDFTFRKIKVVDAVKTSGTASFGKPQQETEFYQDPLTKATILLRRKEFSYDAKGRIIKERAYNSQNALCYEITKDYDSKGQLIQESNALGDIIQYEWDDNRNKIKEKLLRLTPSGYQPITSTRYKYDAANRLIEKSEKHNNHKKFVTTYTYNTLNQLVSEVNPYGHETTYAYDRFGNQTQCISPSVQDVDGKWMHPAIQKQFNLLGQMVSETDENGFTTSYSYNAYGSPATMTYPDGATERLIYYPNGWLKQKWPADGTSISYTYDPKGHLLKESAFDQNGTLLKEEEFIYRGPLLVSKKDAMGLITTYRYDGAGRKIEENSGGLKILKYTYDDFDRIIKIEKEGQSQVFQYDWMNRITSKIQQDSQGKIDKQEEFGYDAQGNLIKESVWQSADKCASTHSFYYSDGSLNWQQNPLGHRNTREYDHHYEENGQRLQKRTSKDPLGRPTIAIDDALNRLIRQEVYEGEKLASRTQFVYDAAGHRIKEHALVLADGNPIREYWIQRSYNNRGLLESETEMPQGKTTRYRYDAMKRLSQKEKPDGVTLNYTYDALGRRQTLTSSDGTISYAYSYDLHDNLIQVHDQRQQRTYNRIYDLWDRLLAEEISPGVYMHYDYDANDRLTRMTLPDGSFVTYTYDPFHLTAIQRFSSSGRLICECKSFEYDRQNHLLKSQTTAGITAYTYDLLGRAVAIEAPYWQSHLDAFDPIGNLLKMRQQDPSGIWESQLTYDRFNQLNSESTIETNQFAYDSLGNCLRKNDQWHTINALNQVVSDAKTEYTYDANGNLRSQSSPQAIYTYDALNRLVSSEKEGNRTTFLYDAFGRCIEISDASGTRQLLYQGDQEMGSLFNGQLQEFRLIHPDSRYDLTLAIELKNQIFFPLQDFRGNICALQRQDGSLAEWTRYSAFGKKISSGDLPEALNPWQFANKREISGLLLFAHRFYNPTLMRWQTADPLGFEDGLNLYSYVHNNPFCYKDPDGQFALALPIVIPIFDVVFGAAATVTFLPAVGTVLGAAAVGYGLYQLAVYASNQINEADLANATETEPQEEEKATNEEGKRKRLKPNPNATGAHTAIKRDPDTGKVTHYETYKPQIDPRNPNQWESEKRYDGQGKGDQNKSFKEKIETPHVHDPNYPGGVRYPGRPWEVPQ